MKSGRTILAGTAAGGLLTYGVQSVLPLTVLLLPIPSIDVPRQLIGNTTITLFSYIAIPIIIGTIIGLLHAEQAWVDGLISGFIVGVFNFIFSIYYLLPRLSDFWALSPWSAIQNQLQAQFTVFLGILIAVWCLLAAFSATATAWSWSREA